MIFDICEQQIKSSFFSIHLSTKSISWRFERVLYVTKEEEEESNGSNLY